MHLSGLVLDPYDDPGHRVMMEIYLHTSRIPELVKSASFMSRSDLDSLPDDVFALIMHQGGNTFRKFACVDPGNTALNVEYFLHEGHKLPAEVQTKTAQNLRVACSWYDLPENNALTKIALGGSILAAVKGAGQAAKNFLGQGVSAVKAAPGQMMSSIKAAPGKALEGYGQNYMKNVGDAWKGVGQAEGLGGKAMALGGTAMAAAAPIMTGLSVAGLGSELRQAHGNIAAAEKAAPGQLVNTLNG